MRARIDATSSSPPSPSVTRPATPTLQPRPGARPLSSPRWCSFCPPSPQRIASSSCSSPPSQPQQPPRCARLTCGRLRLQIWCGNCNRKGGGGGGEEGWGQGWVAASLGPDSPSPLTLGEQLRHLEGRGLYLLWLCVPRLYLPCDTYYGRCATSRSGDGLASTSSSELAWGWLSALCSLNGLLAPPAL